MDTKNLSMCGMNCSECPLYIATQMKDEQMLRDILFLGPNVTCTIEGNGCDGCKANLRAHMCSTCNIRKCCESKGYPNCAYCDQYPDCVNLVYLSSKTREVLDNIKKEINK